MKLKTLFGVVVLLLISIWVIVYIKNATVEKVVAHKGAIEILEKVETNNGTFVLYDKGDFIAGEIHKKSLIGWKVFASSEVINDLGNDSIIRPDLIASVYTDDIGYYYGFVNPNEVKAVRYQGEEFDITYHVQTYYWYLPILSEKDRAGFSADQFSVILKDGSEVYYPFEGL